MDCKWLYFDYVVELALGGSTSNGATLSNWYCSYIGKNKTLNIVFWTLWRKIKRLEKFVILVQDPSQSLRAQSTYQPGQSGTQFVMLIPVWKCLKQKQTNIQAHDLRGGSLSILQWIVSRGEVRKRRRKHIIPHVMCHLSPVKCQLSPVTCLALRTF